MTGFDPNAWAENVGRSAGRGLMYVGLVAAGLAAWLGVALVWRQWPSETTVALFAATGGAGVTLWLTAAHRLNTEAAFAAKDTFAETTFSNAFDAQRAEQTLSALLDTPDGRLLARRALADRNDVVLYDEDLRTAPDA